MTVTMAPKVASNAPALPVGPVAAPERTRPEASRPLPRPGLAAEMHGEDPPRTDLD